MAVYRRGAMAAGDDIRAGDTILVVEDDHTIADLLAYNLKRAGFGVRQEANGRAGLEAALSEPVDLVLLDLMLPGLDGMAASREIKRQRPEMPVIIVTAREEREKMLEGFETGADDYVTKPFDMDVLLARIRARLRGAPGEPGTANVKEVGGLVLDHDAHAVYAGGVSVPLKPKEYDLLAFFFSQPGRLLAREEIVEGVWHHRYLPGSRSLDVHIRRLREKLSRLGDAVEIQTIRGVGYRIVTNGEEAPPDAPEAPDGD